MVRLVDDLLDLNRITHNRFELRRSRVVLAEVIGQAVETCQPLADAAGHELRLSLSPEDCYLDADPARLAQVFGNLLSNACKYTDAGGTITVSAQRQDAEVVVSVKDTGAGIPADELDAIFDMFVQAGRPGAREGLGIGLTLVKRLVDMHGGTVEARSPGEGGGSEFIVRLPLQL
jgi:signal transduction histidine kinase